MKKSKSLNRKRPGVLVRFYPSDLQALNKHCADACTPRENFIRRCVLTELARFQMAITHPGAVPPPAKSLAAVAAQRTKHPNRRAP